MEVKKYLMKMQNIYNCFIDYLEKDSLEEQYQNFVQHFSDYQIFKNKQEFKTVLRCISKISNNYYRSPNFFSKIERILLFFKPKMKELFSNYEIFDFFKRNKRILLFLFNEQMITINDEIYSSLTSHQNRKYDYSYYFYPELKNFSDNEKSEMKEQKENDNNNDNTNEKNEIYEQKINDDDKNDKENFVKKLYNESPDKFNSKRNEGENDDYICELIRNDSIEDFIIFVKKNDYPLKSQIKSSIFETNTYLIRNNTSLIEYSAFYGSIQIFKYLYLNNIKLSPSLWLYSIHGRDPEIISILVDHKIFIPYDRCLENSIKFHNHEFLNYYINNIVDKRFIRQNLKDSFKNNIAVYCFHHYNFKFINEYIKHKYVFYYACYYDYIIIVDYFLRNYNIDINQQVILYIFSLKNEI